MLEIIKFKSSEDLIYSRHHTRCFHSSKCLLTVSEVKFFIDKIKDIIFTIDRHIESKHQFHKHINYF